MSKLLIFLILCQTFSIPFVEEVYDDRPEYQETQILPPFTVESQEDPGL